MASIYFFYNTSGDIAFYAAKAIDSIGANKMACIAQKALDLFGENGPAKKPR
ncbi:DUF4375 domain-containing protein [Halomonas sp. RT37]|uniref:DMP19 family protein n=1 Tax=Halomonas sp. RT37 TaxID=2950872 RepID=A0AAU7KDV6_9GAMM